MQKRSSKEGVAGTDRQHLCFGSQCQAKCGRFESCTKANHMYVACEAPVCHDTFGNRLDPAFVPWHHNCQRLEQQGPRISEWSLKYTSARAKAAAQTLLRAWHRQDTSGSSCCTSSIGSQDCRRTKEKHIIDFENLPDLPEDAFELVPHKDISLKSVAPFNSLLPPDHHYKVGQLCY